MTNYCSVCKRSISEGVYNYSINNFGVALCRKHQSTYNELKSLGELGRKFIKDFVFVYEKGGVGLLLTIIGALMLFFFVLMGNY